MIVYRKLFDQKRDEEVSRITEYFKGRFPLFVKPSNAGSSVGITKIKYEDEIEGALIKAFKEDSKVVVEEGITGRRWKYRCLETGTQKLHV